MTKKPAPTSPAQRGSSALTERALWLPASPVTGLESTRRLKARTALQRELVIGQTKQEPQKKFARLTPSQREPLTPAPRVVKVVTAILVPPLASQLPPVTIGAVQRMFNAPREPSARVVLRAWRVARLAAAADFTQLLGRLSAPPTRPGRV